MEINSIVIKRGDWQGSTIDFYLKNGVVLSFLAPAIDKLEIGDSIHKVKNTYKYDVYRKDFENQYHWYYSYDYSDRGY